MGSLANAPNHQQVCWSVTDGTGQRVPAIEAHKRDQSSEAGAYQELIPSIHESGYNPKEIFSPHPILTDMTFLLLMKYTHDALAKVVVSIVDRWWADTDAMFPTRMPLEAPAEAALQVSDIITLFSNKESTY